VAQSQRHLRSASEEHFAEQGKDTGDVLYSTGKQSNFVVSPNKAPLIIQTYP